RPAFSEPAAHQVKTSTSSPPPEAPPSPVPPSPEPPPLHAASARPTRAAVATVALVLRSIRIVISLRLLRSLGTSGTTTSRRPGAPARPRTRCASNDDPRLVSRSEPKRRPIVIFTSGRGSNLRLR